MCGYSAATIISTLVVSLSERRALPKNTDRAWSIYVFAANQRRLCKRCLAETVKSLLLLKTKNTLLSILY